MATSRGSGCLSDEFIEALRRLEVEMSSSLRPNGEDQTLEMSKFWDSLSQDRLEGVKQTFRRCADLSQVSSTTRRWLTFQGFLQNEVGFHISWEDFSEEILHWLHLAAESDNVMDSMRRSRMNSVLVAVENFLELPGSISRKFSTSTTTESMVNFERRSLTSAHCQLLGEVIGELRRLQNLNLGYTDIGDEGSKALGRGILQLKEITDLHLTLTFNKIRKEGARVLATGICELEKLTKLVMNLEGSKLEDEGIAALAGAIADLKEVKTLELGLWDTQMGVESCAVVRKLVDELNKSMRFRHCQNPATAANFSNLTNDGDQRYIYDSGNFDLCLDFLCIDSLLAAHRSVFKREISSL